MSQYHGRQQAKLVVRRRADRHHGQAVLGRAVRGWRAHLEERRELLIIVEARWKAKCSLLLR